MAVNAFGTALSHIVCRVFFGSIKPFEGEQAVGGQPQKLSHRFLHAKVVGITTRQKLGDWRCGSKILLRV